MREGRSGLVEILFLPAQRSVSKGPGEREEVGEAKPEERRDAGEVHTGTVPRRGQFVAEKETFFSRRSALAVARVEVLARGFGYRGQV